MDPGPDASFEQCRTYSIEPPGQAPGPGTLETVLEPISPIWPEDLVERCRELPDLAEACSEIQALSTRRTYHAERRNDYASPFSQHPSTGRFNPTGRPDTMKTGLAGDRLVDGVYQPVKASSIRTQPIYWGVTCEVLNLDPSAGKTNSSAFGIQRPDRKGKETWWPIAKQT